jgi:hypothetical protein
MRCCWCEGEIEEGRRKRREPRGILAVLHLLSGTVRSAAGVTSPRSPRSAS